MKNQLTAINNLKIDLGLFYIVSFSEYKIKLQGELTEYTRSHCEAIGYKFELTNNSWLQATNEDIEIILTWN